MKKLTIALAIVMMSAPVFASEALPCKNKSQNLLVSNTNPSTASTHLPAARTTK